MCAFAGADAHLRVGDAVQAPRREHGLTSTLPSASSGVSLCSPVRSLFSPGCRSHSHLFLSMNFLLFDRLCSLRIVHGAFIYSAPDFLNDNLMCSLLPSPFLLDVRSLVWCNDDEPATSRGQVREQLKQFKRRANEMQGKAAEDGRELLWREC